MHIVDECGGEYADVFEAKLLRILVGGNRKRERERKKLRNSWEWEGDKTM